MNEKLISMSNADINEIKTSIESQAKIAKKFNVNSIQSNRFMRDSIVGNLVGVNQMNTLQHGWDGFFDDMFPYENKNVKSSAKRLVSFGLKFQDTSDDKMRTLTDEGVFCATSFWGDAGEPDFIVIGNTKNVGERLNKTYNRDTRKSCSASLINCIDNGFEIVAINYDKEQVLEKLSNVSKTLGNRLTLDKIYTKEDLPSLVATMK